MMFQYTLELSPEATTPLEFTAIAFSRSGDRFAALCGLPEPTLVVWSLKTQTVLASAPIVVPCEGLSFDPAGTGALCTLASKRLLTWQLKLVYKTYLLTSTEVDFDADDFSFGVGMQGYIFLGRFLDSAEYFGTSWIGTLILCLARFEVF